MKALKKTIYFLLILATILIPLSPILFLCLGFKLVFILIFFLSIFTFLLLSVALLELN